MNRVNQYLLLLKPIQNWIGSAVVCMIFFSAGCVPGGKNGNKNAECGANQIYDPVSKSCKGVIAPSELPPVGLTSSATIIEDGGAQNITLNYSDVDGNQATSCSLSSIADGIDNITPSCICAGGSCSVSVTPDNNFSGSSSFSYRLGDIHGSSNLVSVAVSVSQVNDDPTISAITDRTGGSAGIEDTMMSIAGISVDEGGGSFEDDQALYVMVTSASTTIVPQAGIVIKYNGADLSFNGATAVTIPSTTADASAGTLSLELTPLSNQNTSSTGAFAITVTVSDSLAASTSTSFNVDFSAVADIPINTLSTTTIAEDTAQSIALTYSDADSDLATSCSVDTLSSLYITSDCACVAGACTIGLRGIDNFSTTSTFASFAYSVLANGVSSVTSTVSVTVTGVNDAPFPFSMADASGSNVDGNGNVSFNESASATTSAIAFDLLGAYDVEGDSLTYALVSGPSNGVLSGCLGISGASNTDLSCSYTPNDGNLSGIGAQASSTFSSLVYTAKADGIFGNSLKIQYIDLPSLTAGNEFVSVTSTTVTVYIDEGNTTNSQIETVVDAHNLASTLVDTTVLVGGTTPAAALTTLSGGSDGMDTFVYKANDGTVDSHNVTININVAPFNDSPVVCQYSKYSQAPECGLNGCIGTTSPVGSLTPNATGLYYYNQSSAACWKSNGTTNSSWELVNSYIANVVVNEKDNILINSIRVDEGGGDASEDAQTLEITALSSSNAILLPTSNIKFYYNDTLTATGTPFGSGASEDLNPFRIEMTPVGGQSGVSTIGFSIQDSATSTTSLSFTVTINNVSAIHGGWLNLASVGPKVNKFNQLKGAAKVCNYSRTKCNTGTSCVGSGSPAGVVTADDANVLYYDSTNDQCYYSSTSTNSNWNSFNSYCNISPSEWAVECSALGASCMGTSDPTSEGLTPTKHNNFYYDLTNDICYRSTDISGTSDWESYLGTATTTLAWNSFTISGGGTLAGWNVYRRISQVGATTYSFDYDFPINKTMINSGTLAYTDNVSNSWFAPVPGTVYFYEVRPVITVSGSSLVTGTNEVFKTVRMIAPPANMSFVHRWIANKEICEKQGVTTDSSNNFRCLLEGPGSYSDAPSAGTNYYDIGEDLLVDSFEAGCPYASTPYCDTSDGSCLGLVNPNGAVTGSATGIAYYNRSNGKCYINTDAGTTWAEYTSVTSTYSTLAGYRNAELPPLVYVHQDDADGFCDNAQDIQNVLGLSTDPIVKLPTRKQQRSFSLWDDDTIDDSSIEAFEEGQSLNSGSKCNTSSAHGVTANYTDTTSPDSNSLFTLPGSSSSNIRSMMTGSTQTNSCVSRFKIQDHVGNVSEWVRDRLLCSTSSTCVGVINGDSIALASGNTTNDFQAGDGSDDFDFYRLGLKGATVFGPCINASCDTPLTSWKLEDVENGALAMSLPLGLPTRGDLATTYAASDVVASFKTIGTGITNTQLHEDTVIFNTENIYNEANNCGSMAAGGGYLTGTGSGMYHIEMTPCTTTASSTPKKVDIGFRCVAPVPSGNYTE